MIHCCTGFICSDYKSIFCPDSLSISNDCPALNYPTMVNHFRLYLWLNIFPAPLLSFSQQTATSNIFFVHNLFALSQKNFFRPLITYIPFYCHYVRCFFIFRQFRKFISSFLVNYPTISDTYSPLPHIKSAFFSDSLLASIYIWIFIN